MLSSGGIRVLTSWLAIFCLVVVLGMLGAEGALALLGVPLLDNVGGCGARLFFLLSPAAGAREPGVLSRKLFTLSAPPVALGRGVLET